MRMEHDYLGEMELDDRAYYGIQTSRGMHMSDVTGHSVGQDGAPLIRALAEIKKAAARANLAVGGLDSIQASAIERAADEVLDGTWKDQFPVDLITGGGGVSIHMNMNEVLARRASELSGGVRLHPNTHVNMGQSTNDVLPSAMLIATCRLLHTLAGIVTDLAEAVEKKQAEFAHVVKLGRTCLQDALPITLGQEFSGWSSFLRRQAALLEEHAEECLALPLGGTAVGTGVGSLPGYSEAVFVHLRQISGLNVVPADNRFDSMQNADVYIRLSATLKALAAGLSKMASDLRLMSSGPRAGLGEIELPAVLPGSSIMPGKINPILPELMIQVYFLVYGNDAAITLAAERGELDLNVWESVVSKCVFESCRLLSHSISLFNHFCIVGIRANEAHCRRQAEESTATASVVASVFGYETGSKIARSAVASGQTIKETVVREGLMEQADADALLDPEYMTDSAQMAERIMRARTHLRRH